MQIYKKVLKLASKKTIIFKECCIIRDISQDLRTMTLPLA